MSGEGVERDAVLAGVVLAGELLRAWLLRACLRAAVGRGLVWVRGRRRSCAALSLGELFFFTNAQTAHSFPHPGTLFLLVAMHFIVVGDKHPEGYLSTSVSTVGGRSGRGDMRGELSTSIGLLPGARNGRALLHER